VTYQGRRPIARTFDEELGANGVCNPSSGRARSGRWHDDPAVRDLARGIREAGAPPGAPASRAIHEPLGLWLLHGGQVTPIPRDCGGPGRRPARWLGTLSQLTSGNGHDVAETESRSTSASLSASPRKSRSAAARHAAPLMRGTQTAIVWGRQGEEIYTDSWVGSKCSSTGIARASGTSDLVLDSGDQPGPGGLRRSDDPRIGQDSHRRLSGRRPGRPIITGRVYNANRRPAVAADALADDWAGPEPIAAMQNRPQSLPAACTRTSIRSNSTPGVRARTSDLTGRRAGSELVYINATRDAVSDGGKRRHDHRVG